MTPEIDLETLELCRQLCTRAGMLFEDTSAHALLIGQQQPEELRFRIEDLRRMASTATALLDAAGRMTDG